MAKRKKTPMVPVLEKPKHQKPENDIDRAVRAMMKGMELEERFGSDRYWTTQERMFNQCKT